MKVENSQCKQLIKAAIPTVGGVLFHLQLVKGNNRWSWEQNQFGITPIQGVMRALILMNETEVAPLYSRTKCVVTALAW